MKITIITLIALGLTTCCLMLFCACEQYSQDDVQYSKQPDKKEWFDADGRRAYLVVIDSCEYLAVSRGANFGLLTHKGNCNNPFHLKSR